LQGGQSAKRVPADLHAGTALRAFARPTAAAAMTRHMIAMSCRPSSRFAAWRKIFHFQVASGEYKLP
jgi:hypothetical protein